MSARADDAELRRAKQIFQFLCAFNEKNNPIVRLIDDQPWHYFLRDLPDHPTITVSWPDQDEEAEEDQSLSLEGRRVSRTAPPSPPEQIEDW